jgi:glycosyltransferase involved in cell wall biosynthesis
VNVRDHGPDPPGPLRVLGLVEGDDRAAMSGVAGYLLDALARRFDVVGRLDYAPAGRARWGLAMRTVRPSRSAWRGRFHASVPAHRALSRSLVDKLASAPERDVALQVHGWVAEQPRPYVLYIDQTRLMAHRGWPGWIPLPRRDREQLLRWEREMYAGAAHIFTMGQPARDSIEIDYGIAPEAITVVGGGLNLRELPALTELRPSRDIIFVGRDFERKGGDCLLEAFIRVRQAVPDARLHIVGAGRRFTGKGIVAHGKISGRAELTGLYRRARVFVMPSRYEPWGLVFPEAMAYGVPCIGTTVQSIPEILGFGDAGTLVAPEDPVALADALVELLTNDEHAARLAAAGRQRVETWHTWDHVAQRIAGPLLAAVRGPGVTAAAGRTSPG